MNITITVHESWLRRPDSLRQMIAVLDGLEQPAPAPPSGRMKDEGGRMNESDPTHPSSFIPHPSGEDDPEEQAPARRAPGRAEARDRDQDLDGEDEDAPTDGRQLLGWASKQDPDMKGPIIGWGKKKGLHSKIVEWTPQQVAAAYRFARSRLASTR
jgi:hypothetical protein